ncbi:hypothetical protein JNL27_13370 [bacterium]|nr:hypothetical protein [bacterium]
MYKYLLLAFVFYLTAGCTSNYYLSEKKELDESDRKNRYAELEQIIQTIKPGDEVTLVLYNGETFDGTFYSNLDGIVSLRMGDAFRDTELSDVRGIALKPQDRMKKVMMALMFATIAGIITTFVVTH